MINTEKLKNVVSYYKDDFLKRWKDEKYKWEAVKHFQDNWKINKTDFAEMFMEATAKHYNLLASGHTYPRDMIRQFAEKDPEATRAMFINLYDEDKDLTQRLDKFKSDADELKIKYDDGTWNNHYQNTNAISTYLWFRYPDKYYIYRYSYCLEVAKELESDFVPKADGSSLNVVEGIKLYDLICEYLKTDSELVAMLKAMLKSNVKDMSYPDSELKTLTIDLGYYMYKKREDWLPKYYDPKISVDTWLELFKDEKVFYESSFEILKRMKDNGGMGTSTELANKYGETKNFYNKGSSSLAERVAEKTGCEIMPRDEENSRWWPILYVGKNADKDSEGSFIWKLRDELSEALNRIDLSPHKLYVKKYWWLVANPKIWKFSDIEIGQEEDYTLYNEKGNKRKIFKNFLDVKVGDKVIGYSSSPDKEVVALAEITQENDGDKIYFKKVSDLTNPINISKLENSAELSNMQFLSNPQGSLFKLTKEEYDFIIGLDNESIEPYSKEDFLKEVYMTRERLDTLISLLEKKKNLILLGAPGVGKTFSAKRLAYAIMGCKDEKRIEFIQFHQNYTYEDFIMGYKPYEDGFKLEEGIFYEFCLKAAEDQEKPYFFIIDEINRGNMSKIFGELLFLIESSYRGTEATLAYNKKPFSVPENLHIIGMMNTADRSLAMIDYALRRRFSFFEMEPGFNSEGFKAYQGELDNESFNILIELTKSLNNEITRDNSLGRGFCIGHSYFCGQKECTEEWLVEVVEYDIIPMLSEYWFDEPTKLMGWENQLRGVFNG